MVRYIGRRLLFFVPTALVVSLIAFGLSLLAPGDPVELRSKGGCNPTQSTRSSYRSAEQCYAQTAVRLGLDKPAFYFSLTPKAFPDTLYKVLQPERRQTLRSWIRQLGNWTFIQAYYKSVAAFDDRLFDVPDSLRSDAFVEIRNIVRDWYIQDDATVVQASLQRIDTLLSTGPSLQALLGNHLGLTNAAFKNMLGQPERINLWKPDVKWYGLENRYHLWMSRFIRGDFGISYQDGRPVAKAIGSALYWTLLINIFSILLAYGLSIPLGVWAATSPKRWVDRLISTGVFLLYSLPAFWVATLLVVFFTTPTYTAWLDWFPSVGLGNLTANAPFWDRFWERAGHLILPVFCNIYPSLAFLTRQVRSAMKETMAQDYIRTARAKGLPERMVIWRHGFRNALFPLITSLAGVFPAVLAGSITLEIIFNIPGMGKLIYDGIFTQNWPIVFTVLMMGALLTMTGVLVSDLLYAWADPRVSFSREPERQTVNA